MIKAEIIVDSKNEFGNRITTMIVTMPRIILAEFNTHRMFSKNSASSRAIPFEKMLKSVEENPFIPIAWQKDHKGMQGNEYISNEVDINLNQNAWLRAKDNAVSSAEYLNHGVKEGRDNGVTKQLCNRLLEPFMNHTVIVTATEWENFFSLRCPSYRIGGKGDEKSSTKVYKSKKDAIKDYPNSFDEPEINWRFWNEGQAEIHMMALAEAMWDAMNESTPRELKAGEWHIPFGDTLEEINDILANDDGSNCTLKEINEFKVKVATARCARVSYTVVGEEDKKPNYENDIKLHDNLMKAGHMSPFEHCAQAMSEADIKQNRIVIRGKNDSDNLGWSGNFKGFIQYRKTLPNENITK
jgi:thymidylate synthase ThyX